MTRKELVHMLAQEVRSCRRAQEMTQQEIGTAAGVSKTSIYKFEKMGSEPGAVVFLRIWKALGRDFRDLETMV